MCLIPVTQQRSTTPSSIQQSSTTSSATEQRSTTSTSTQQSSTTYSVSIRQIQAEPVMTSSDIHIRLVRSVVEDNQMSTTLYTKLTWSSLRPGPIYRKPCVWPWVTHHLNVMDYFWVPQVRDITERTNKAKPIGQPKLSGYTCRCKSKCRDVVSKHEGMYRERLTVTPSEGQPPESVKAEMLYNMGETPQSAENI